MQYAVSPRLPVEQFKKLHHLPDPVPGGEHYDDFESLYGTETIEDHRPLLKAAPKVKCHGMPFNPSTQRAKNANLVPSVWRMFKMASRALHSKHKLKPEVKDKVVREVESLMYTCGSVFQLIDGNDDTCLREVFVRQNLTCRDGIEITYYGAGNKGICIHCATLDDLIAEAGYYPICQACRAADVMVSSCSEVFTPKY